MKNKQSKGIKFGKRNLIIIAGVVLAVMIFAFTSTFSDKIPENIQRACIKDKACFDVEIADTDEEKVRGLSGRENLTNSSGMLFIFEENIVPGFWMNEMKFPIDIVWIDKNLRVVDIDKGLTPCENIVLCPSYYPAKPVRYVLEVNSGEVWYREIQVGDKVEFFD